MTLEEQQTQAQSEDVRERVAVMRAAVTSVARELPTEAAHGYDPLKVHKNDALRYAKGMMTSSLAAQTDGQLLKDIMSVMEGGCIYLRGFYCKPKDFTVLQSLTRDLQEHQEKTGMVNWSQHFKFENPGFSPTFNWILQRLDAYFDLDILATRWNVYNDGSDWKPFHHDSHAYGAKGVKEDFTAGCSFGATRELAFLHDASGQEFRFPQDNGDIFAFNSEVNKNFKHGVPRVKGNPSKVGPRFSIIAWGRRRTINERNGGGPGLPRQPAAVALQHTEQTTEDTRRSALSNFQLPERGTGGPSKTPSSRAVADDHAKRNKGASAGGSAAGERRDAAQTAPQQPPRERSQKEPRRAAVAIDDVADAVQKLVVKEGGVKKAEGEGGQSRGGRRRGGRLQHGWAS